MVIEEKGDRLIGKSKEIDIEIKINGREIETEIIEIETEIDKGIDKEIKTETVIEKEGINRIELDKKIEIETDKEEIEIKKITELSKEKELIQDQRIEKIKINKKLNKSIVKKKDKNQNKKLLKKINY